MTEAATRPPDVRRSLQLLAHEWSGCQACELGQYRVAVGGQFVFGEGTTNGVMFVGEGPGGEEEKEGRPFVGPSGTFLHKVLKRLGFKNVYITNAVCCRSWEYQYDTEGHPQTDRHGNPRRRDAPPGKLHMAACNQRLMEEIYSVDPVLIVALGNNAAEALLKAPVSMAKDSGNIKVIEVPGASLRPSLTAGKKVWARRVGAKDDRRLVAPSEQNIVLYPMIPLYHPAFIISNMSDQRPGSPSDLFARGILHAYNLYTRYLQEVAGERIVESTLTKEDVYEGLNDNEGSDYG